jgi:hypothetical protein
MERVLAGGPEAAPARLRALEGMGWHLQCQGDLDRADAAYAEMLDLSRELDDKENIATALNGLGILAVTRGDNERAGALLEENLSVLRELEESGAATTRKKFFVFNLLGVLALNEETDYAKGISLWEESLALAREVGDAYHVGTTLCNLGYATLLQGDHQCAAVLSEESLEVTRELTNAEIVPETLVNLGLAALGQGDRERAAASFLEALSMSQNAGRTATVINAFEAMASLAGATGEDSRAAILWGPQRRRARIPASLCLPASGPSTNPTWLPPVPGWGRRRGNKQRPRGGRCRWILPQSTPRRRKKPNRPRLPCPDSGQPASSPPASGRWRLSSPVASPIARSPSNSASPSAPRATTSRGFSASWA